MEETLKRKAAFKEEKRSESSHADEDCKDQDMPLKVFTLISCSIYPPGLLMSSYLYTIGLCIYL